MTNAKRLEGETMTVQEYATREGISVAHSYVRLSSGQVPGGFKIGGTGPWGIDRALYEKDRALREFVANMKDEQHA